MRFNHRKNLPFVFSLCFLGISVSYFSQEKKIDSIHLKALKTNQKIEKQAFSVSSIDTKELHNTSTDAKEVLNRVSGVRILEDGGTGSVTQLTLNGFSGNQVKVFLDGIPMEHYSSSFGLNNIPVNSIDRIDVYKGVVPVSLGTDALGGVIHIITNKKKNFIDASYTFGSFNTHKGSLNGAYTNKKTGFIIRGNVNTNYSDNDYRVFVPIVRNYNIQYYDNVKRFHDRYRSANAKIEAGWVDKKLADQLLLGILLSSDDKQVQHGATMGTVYGGITNESQTVAPSLKYEKKNLFLEGLDVSFFTSYNLSTSNIKDVLKGIKYNWLGEVSMTPGSNDGEFFRTNATLMNKEWSAGLNVGYKLADKHSFVLNHLFSHFDRKVSDTENPNRIDNFFPKTLTKSVFGLAYQYSHSPQWNTTAFAKSYSVYAKGSKLYDFGLPTQRTDVLKQQQSSVGYGLASTYIPFKGFQVKASYENAYRMPTATELFGDGLFVQQNPALKPEQSHNINFGLGYDFTIHATHRFQLGTSFIYRNAKDLIYQVVTVASPMTRYDNLAKTRTLGIEGSVSYRYKNTFHLEANATFQDITDQADFIYNNSYTGMGYQTNYYKGFRLPNTPYLFGNAMAGVTFKDILLKKTTLDINYRFNYVHQYFLSWAELGSRDDKKVIPTQNAHNIELIYSLQNGKYNIGIECRNITDERLYDKYYLQKPGRAFFVKLRWTL